MKWLIKFIERKMLIIGLLLLVIATILVGVYKVNNNDVYYLLGYITAIFGGVLVFQGLANSMIRKATKK